MSDDYDRLVATVRLQERVVIAKMMNEWRRLPPSDVYVMLVMWINGVIGEYGEAKAAAAESAENSACTDGDSE